MLIGLLQQMRKEPKQVFRHKKSGLFLQAKVTEEQSCSVAKSEEE